MSWAKGIAAALTGTLEGFAEAAVKEDEKRDELTKVTLAQAMKNIEQAKELARTAQEEKKLEDETVDALMSYKVGNEAVTRAQATAAYRQYGKNAASMLLQGQLEFEGAGELNPIQPVKRGTTDLTAIEGMGAGGGMFSKGRFESVSKNTKSLLQSMGYDPAGVDVVQKSKIAGDLVVKPGAGLNKVTTDDKYTNVPGVQGGMVRTVTSQSPTGQITTRFTDLFGRDVTEEMQQGLQGGKYRIADSADALFGGDIKEIGLAFVFQDDGSVKPAGYDMAYTDDGRRLKVGTSGKFDTEITDSNVVSLTSTQVAALGGASGVMETFDKLGKEGRKAYQDFNERAEAFESLTTVVTENMELLDIHGNKLVTDVGQLAQVGAYLENNFGVAIDFAGEFIEVSALKEAYDAVSGDVSGLKQQLSTTTDPKAKLAIAQKIYAANQVILAYNYAKSTGDTRISNQDFDAFIKTVSAGSKESQQAIYQSRMKQALSGVSSSYKTLSQYTSMAGTAGESILKSIPQDRTTAAFSTKVDSMFDSTVPARSEQQIVEEVTNNIDQAKQFRADKVLYNPNTNQRTDSSDPDAVTVIAVLDSSGNLVLGTDNQPIIETDPNADAKFVQGLIPSMIGNGLIKVK